MGGAFPTLAFSVGGESIRFVTLIPANVTRGVVTLERIRGHIQLYWNGAQLAANFDRFFVKLGIQLVPVRNGVILDASVLSLNNSADQENNAIVWQRSYYPDTGGTITAPGAVELHTQKQSSVVDVKSRRRFDRALWALVLSANVTAAAEAGIFATVKLRGLFRASDAL